MNENFAQSLAIRLEVLPGKTLLEKFSNAEKFGFSAVELPGRFLSEYYEELMTFRKKLPLKISSISLGFKGSLLSKEESERKQCCNDIKRLLELCGELGAVGLVMPPLLFVDKCNGFTGKAGDEMILEQLPELADFAAERSLNLMLEPVNRGETDYLTTIDHALQICNAVNRDGLGITADYFHMSREETDMAQALRKCGKWLKHFHISETPDRTEPRPGGLDFQTAFDVLRELGYRGYTVLECRSLSGAAEKVLPDSIAYLNSLMK